MKDELEQKLVKKYPEIFSDYGGDPMQTCMTWGFECGDGWYNIIDELCSNIEKIREKYKKRNIEVIAVQVKEKFAGLRFYFHYTENSNIFNKLNRYIQRIMFSRKLGIPYWWLANKKRKVWKSPYEKISDLVERAELESCKTCEQCGEPGKVIQGCWIRTLCEKCNNERNKKGEKTN
jgi:exoribonuclease II